MTILESVGTQVNPVPTFRIARMESYDGHPYYASPPGRTSHTSTATTMTVALSPAMPAWTRGLSEATPTTASEKNATSTALVECMRGVPSRTVTEVAAARLQRARPRKYLLRTE